MANKIIQLDYETGEYVDDYPSIRTAAYDNWLDEIALGEALRKGNGTAVMPIRKLTFTKAFKPKANKPF